MSCSLTSIINYCKALLSSFNHYRDFRKHKKKTFLSSNLDFVLTACTIIITDKGYSMMLIVCSECTEPDESNKNVVRPLCTERDKGNINANCFRLNRPHRIKRVALHFEKSQTHTLSSRLIKITFSMIFVKYYYLIDYLHWTISNKLSSKNAQIF